MLRGEAANTNCIAFGLTRMGLERTIYHTRREHANHMCGYQNDYYIQVK
jgi:hypothetical protein